MATIDERELDLTGAGGIVFLASTAKRDWTEDVGSGVTVRTAPDSRAAIVHGLSSSLDLEGVLADSRRFVNEALDLMAVRSLGVYSVAESDSPAVGWRVSGDNVEMLTTSYVHSTFTMSIGGAPNPDTTPWHPSMRYFRLSQTTNDLFDAFRNLYLALESILSTIEPVQTNANGRSEPEGQWLKRALSTAEQRLLASNAAYNLGSWIDPPSAVTGPTGVDAVMSDLYANVRTTVFHTKNGRAVALPQHVPDRAAVAAALDRYASFYNHLAELELNARFLRSGIGQSAVDEIGDGVMSRFVVGASSEVLGLDNFDEAAAAAMVPMASARAPEFDTPFAPAVRGVLTGNDVPTSMVIRSIGATMDDQQPAAAEPLGGDLTLDGVDSWEHILVSRMRGGGLKWNYAS